MDPLDRLRLALLQDQLDQWHPLGLLALVDPARLAFPDFHRHLADQLGLVGLAFPFALADPVRPCRLSDLWHPLDLAIPWHR